MTEPDSLETGCETPRRHAAGENPAKRDQILDGARKVFMEKGFDGASMNDIFRAAGVSKGTLYVYFDNKVDLFEAMIARERDRLFEGIDAALSADVPLEERLRAAGTRLAKVLCSDKVVRAQRIVIGAVDKFPELGSRFHDAGARRTHERLALLFEQEAAAGRMTVPDPVLAAQQFVELVTAGIWRARLFAVAPKPPADAELAAIVESAIAMFLAAYVTG